MTTTLTARINQHALPAAALTASLYVPERLAGQYTAALAVKMPEHLEDIWSLSREEFEAKWANHPRFSAMKQNHAQMSAATAKAAVKPAQSFEACLSEFTANLCLLKTDAERWNYINKLDQPIRNKVIISVRSAMLAKSKAKQNTFRA